MAATAEEFVPAMQIVTNTDAIDIPAFAAVMVDETFPAGNGLGVKRPTAAGVQSIMFVGAAGIPVGGSGLATFVTPAVALYDVADGDPTRDAAWGTSANSFKLSLNKSGFTAVLKIADGVGLFRSAIGTGSIVEIGLVDETDIPAGLPTGVTVFGVDVQEWNGPLPTDHENGERAWVQVL